MSRLILRLVLPLTVIVFFGITKWWYVDVVDGTDVIVYGFPLVHTSPGLHTSMSLHFFVLEMLVDFLVYFLICLAVVFGVNKYLFPIKVGKIVFAVLMIINTLIFSLFVLLASMTENLISFQRHFEVEVLETGHHFFWQHVERPDYDKYHPKKNPQ